MDLKEFIKRSYICRWVTGKVEVPRITTFMLIRVVLRFTV